MLAVGFSDGSLVMITTHCPDGHAHLEEASKGTTAVDGDDAKDQVRESDSTSNFTLDQVALGGAGVPG